MSHSTNSSTFGPMLSLLLLLGNLFLFLYFSTLVKIQIHMRDGVVIGGEPPFAR